MLLRYSPDFFRAAGIGCVLPALTTCGLIFLPRAYPAPNGLEEEVGRRRHHGVRFAVAHLLYGIATWSGSGLKRVVRCGFFGKVGLTLLLPPADRPYPPDARRGFARPSGRCSGCCPESGAGHKKRLNLTFNNALTTTGQKLTNFFNRLMYLYIRNFLSENHLS